MTIFGIDIAERMEGYFNTFTTAIEESASQINTVALTALHLATFASDPSGYLMGLLISVCVNAVDIALGDKLSSFINRLIPSDPVQKISLLASLGLLVQLAHPPFFALGMGIHAGREVTTLTSQLFRSF